MAVDAQKTQIKIELSPSRLGQVKFGALLEQFLAHQHLGALRLRVARLQEYGLQKLEVATTTVAALLKTQAHRRQYLLIVTKKAPLTVKGPHYSLPQPVAVQ